jgi:hypothetical protein
MNKKINFVRGLTFCLIFLLFFIGCAPKQETPKFYGLKFDFVTNAPPNQVSIGQKFPIIVNVENVGGYDVYPGRAVFYLRGIGTNLNDYSSRLENNVVLSKKDTIPGTQKLIFAQNAYSSLSLQNPLTIDMVLTSCYEYSTITEAEICVAKQSGVCKIEGNKITEKSNTVAPIKITSLTERVEGNKLKITFTIQNVGKGRVFIDNANCDGIIQNQPQEMIKENYAKIQINDNGVGFQCKLLGPELASITGLNGYTQIGLVECEKTLTDENFQSLMKIYLTYKYIEEVKKPLTIYP